MQVKDFGCILRPHVSGSQMGYWYVQNDNDHAPLNVSTTLIQNSWDMQINLTFTGSKVIWADSTPDDGFTEARILSSAGGVGLSGVRIALWKDNIVNNQITRSILNPGSIVSHMILGNGNLWVRGQMWVP